MGFTNATNTFAATYARTNPERLLPYGGVHARFTKDPPGDVDRLVDLGIRLLKIHPPHQGFPANAYTDGLEALRSEEHTSELQSRLHLVCRLLLAKKKSNIRRSL